MNEYDIEDLGKLSDTADNYLEYTTEPGPFSGLPIAMRLDALRNGLTEIRDTLRQIYIQRTGENVWADTP